jgi:type IV secretory pathway TrbD component
MARPLLIAHRENATIEELKQVSRVGANETVTRCTAMQMLLAGADRKLVCNALLVTNRALRKWINRFNLGYLSGVFKRSR